MSQKEIDEKIRKKPNVLTWRDDLTKITASKDTGKSCITVFVSEKVERRLLSNRQAIPKKIGGKLTDVIELRSDDFELGDTDVGRELPEVQKRMMGVQK